MMSSTYQKLISLVVLIAFSVFFIPGQGYAAAPTIKQVFVNPNQTEIPVGSDPIVLTVQAVGTGLTYKWEITGPGEIEGTGESVFYVAPKELDRETMQAIITVTVTNKEEQEDSKTVILTILAPLSQEPVSGPVEPSSPEETDSPGKSDNTKYVLGAVAGAALATGVVLAASGGGDDKADDPSLSGTWSGLVIAAEGWANISLTLVQNGNTVTGHGSITGLTGSISFDTVAGTNVYPTVNLTLEAHDYNPTYFNGSFSDENSITGTLSGSGFDNDRLMLSRQ